MINNKMSDVSVIGAGVMGSALIEVLAASGAEVTAWNRTKEKAEALSGPRVHIAESTAEALRSSPITIIVVSDQELSRTVVKKADADLNGRIVASTSFVTPDQARAFNSVVQEAGGRYLDLAIPAYPSEVQSGSGVYLISGEQAAYEEHRDWFERIGRTTTYVGNTPGSAYISEMAVLLAYLPMAVGLLQGLRICDKHNISMEWFKKTALELYPYQIRSLLGRVIVETDRSPANVEASINTWKIGVAEYADYLREMDLDAGIYDEIHRLFTAASDAGHGDADWTRIAEFTSMDRGGEGGSGKNKDK